MQGLDLKVVRTRGRAEKIPLILGTGELTSEHLAAREAREAGIKPSHLERLSARHHEIARAVASGDRTSEIAVRFGITASRVSILKQDPAFQDLVAAMQEQRLARDDAEVRVVAGIRNEALIRLWDRLEDEGEDIDTETLLKVITVTADRSGMAPKRVEERNVTFNFGDRLEAARQRARQMLTIDVTPTMEAELDE